MNFEISAFAFILFAFFIRIFAVLRLKNKHPKKWKELGEPSVLFQGTNDAASMDMTKFLFKGHFFEINDTVLQIQCALFDVTAIAGTIFMIASVFA